MARPRIRARQRLCSGLVLACLAMNLCAAPAAGLRQDFDAALGHDAGFATAMADVDAHRMQAGLARTAFYPEARLSVSQLDSDTAARRTLSVTQPLISVDRWLSLQEADPREAAAQAKLDQSRSDLAVRLFKSIAALIEARERLTLNQRTVEALQVQATAARRAFELGQGTVTDVRDTDLRLAQARSQTFTLQATLQDAERRYQAVVGRPPALAPYRLRDVPGDLVLPGLPDVMQRAAAMHPMIRSSEVALRLAEIAAKRAKAAYLPSLNAVAQRSVSAGTSASTNAIALRMDIPLSASSVTRWNTSEIDVRRAREAARDARQQVALEAERQYSQLQAARAELPVRREAVRAAELSVSASEQSFVGGVRTRLDVLNALQSQFQSQADHVSAQLRLGEALLSLQVIIAGDLDAVLDQVQASLFEP